MKSKIVTSHYYQKISKNLFEGAVRELDEKNISYDSISVPGTFEISLAIKHHINKGAYNGYIALGCIIKGETYHFEILSNECIRSINSLSIDNNIPIGFGVITCNNIQQAEQRSYGPKNKGREAALACIKMINVLNNE